MPWCVRRSPRSLTGSRSSGPCGPTGFCRKIFTAANARTSAAAARRRAGRAARRWVSSPSVRGKSSSANAPWPCGNGRGWNIGRGRPLPRNTEDRWKRMDHDQERQCSGIEPRSPGAWAVLQRSLSPGSLLAHRDARLVDRERRDARMDLPHHRGGHGISEGGRA